MSSFRRIRPDALAPGEAGMFRIVVEQAPMESFEIELKFVDLADVPAGETDETPEPDPQTPTETDLPAE